MRGGGSGSKRSGVDSRSDQVDSGFFPTRSRDRDEDFDSLVWRGGPTKSLSLSRHSPRQGHDSLLYEGGDAFQPKPTDPFVSASQTDHPPRVTPSKPTKLPKPVTNVHIGERKDKNASTSSSSAASSMGGLFRGLKAKKEAKRIQDPTPIEQHDVDFEVRTTSGDSDSPYLGGHARTASKDDMWIGSSPLSLPCDSSMKVRSHSSFFFPFLRHHGHLELEPKTREWCRHLERGNLFLLGGSLSNGL